MTTDRHIRIAAGLAASILVLAACRAGDDPEEPAVDDTAPATEAALATDVGVTEDACPAGVNPDNGCIYLGTISDLTVGPFAPLAVPITEAQAAFWARVNADGGIAGYDVDASTYVRDAEYNPEIHNQMYQEIRGEVLALAQTLGSSQTLAVIEDMRSDSMVGVPASWNSAWEFDPLILESGANYCFESMNGVDWAMENRGEIDSVMAVHFPNDYGADAAAGARVAAEAHGAEFTAVETPPGQDNQTGAISAILSAQPDLVFVTTGPSEMATIVGGAASQQFQGTFVGSSPTWNPALLQTPAAPALEALYFQAAPWAPWDGDTPGHEAMREALGDVTPNDGYVAGWAWSYALLAAIEAAVDAGDLTREGLAEAAATLESVDYEGMLPDEAGATSGDPAEVAFRESMVNAVNPDASAGVAPVTDFTAGPTATAYDFAEACFALE